MVFVVSPGNRLVVVPVPLPEDEGIALGIDSPYRRLSVIEVILHRLQEVIEVGYLLSIEAVSLLAYEISVLLKPSQVILDASIIDSQRRGKFDIGNDVPSCFST